MILAQIHYKLSHGQLKLPNILSQNGQNNLDGNGQWPQFSVPAENIAWCIFGANLVILDQIHYKLLHGQIKFPNILSQNGQNDVEGHCQWPPFSIPAASIPWCMLGVNLVIPVQICHELSCGQGKVYGQTDRQTDGHRQRQYPFGQKGQGEKTAPFIYVNKQLGTPS